MFEVIDAPIYGNGTRTLIGVELEKLDHRTVRHVRRPVRVETHLGYGRNTHGTGTAVTRVAHDGPMSYWRADGTPIERPSQIPYLNTPDEEHGWTWVADVDIPSDQPARYYFDQVEITEGEARRLVAEYQPAP